MTPNPGKRRVLVASMGEIVGDGLVKLAVVHAVRAAFPDAHITWAALEHGTVYNGVLTPLVIGLIDAVVGPEELKNQRFDIVIDTQEKLRVSLGLKRLCTGTFISPAWSFLLSARKPSGPQPLAVRDRLLQLVALAADHPVFQEPVRFERARYRNAAKTLLPDGPTYIGFAPGSGGRNKCWPLENYLEVARRHAARGRVPVFFIGPQESDWLQSVRAAVPAALLPEWDRTDAYADCKGPLLVAALAGRLKIGVANDAGPAHMFALGGAPVLSLFTDHRRAAKFPPATLQKALVAEDYGGQDMALLPLETVDICLEQCIMELS